MAVVNFLTFNAPTKIWSRTTTGIISYPSTVTAAASGPFIVNPIIVPFDPVHETGGSFWRLTEGPNIGFLVSAHSNSLGYGDITVTQTGQPDSYAEGIAKINPLAAWRLLIKDMGGETGGSANMLTFNDDTFVWSRTTTGIIKWPHEFEHEAGGPYAVNPIVVPFDPEHETGGSFWRLTEGPFTGFLVSFHSNSLGYGDITVEENPDFDRSPGAVLATLGPGDVVPLPPTGAGDQPAHLAGASLTYNTGGEMHFTLLVDSPFIDIPKPKRTHYAIEFYDTDAEEWYESFAGWIWDMDATDTEVVFYGIDYLAAFQYTVDERYDPELGIEVSAPNGSKYTNKTIREIVIDQLDYAIGKPYSMVGFVVRGTIAPMPYVISAIYSTFKDTLTFVVGLIDSHRAGTGKQSRISVRKIDGVYTVMVENDPGVDRHNLLIQYGLLAQGYRAIPFGTDWASRVNFIGRNKEGLKVMYRAESSAVDQGLWGRIAQAPVYMDTEDYNDMKRRALQAAIDASRLGRQISVGLKLGSFRPLEGYDICDNLPVDINHGAVTTKDWGSDDFGIDPSGDPSGVMASFWTILGIAWESYDDGHWMTGLTLYPRGKRPTGQLGLLSSMTDTTLGGVEVSTWPFGPPPPSALLVSFLAQRDSSSYGPEIGPIGSNGTTAVPDAEWTNITYANADSGGGQSAKLTLSYRDSEANEPPDVFWGYTTALNGSARPRSHSAGFSGLSGAPTVSGNFVQAWPGAASILTSPDVDVPSAGILVFGFAERRRGSGEGIGGVHFSLTPQSEEVVSLSQGWAHDNFGPYSWFGYIQTEAGGTFHVDLERDAGALDAYARGWVWAFWPGSEGLLVPSGPEPLEAPSELVVGNGPPS